MLRANRIDYVADSARQVVAQIHQLQLQNICNDKIFVLVSIITEKKISLCTKQTCLCFINGK